LEMDVGNGREKRTRGEKKEQEAGYFVLLSEKNDRLKGSEKLSGRVLAVVLERQGKMSKKPRR